MEVALPDGHVVSDDRARLDMGFVHAALEGVYWMEGRSRALTERSWANCLCLGVLDAGGVQVGCARVLTDYALRAHLADLVIAAASRGRGLGVGLVGVILLHPELRTVRRWTLATRDAHGLYRRFGFRAAAPDPDWMTLERG